jgi:hypothetical protein
LQCLVLIRRDILVENASRWCVNAFLVETGFNETSHPASPVGRCKASHKWFRATSNRTDGNDCYTKPDGDSRLAGISDFRRGCLRGDVFGSSCTLSL